MIDYRHWHNIHEHMLKQKYCPLTEDSDFYGLKFQDYFVMNRVMYHTRPQRVGWIGGFSNLDFFLSQHGVDSIMECTNVDHTPVSEWCKRKHQLYIEKYQYRGGYKFVEQKYEQSMLTDVDFLSTLSAPLKELRLDVFPNINTVVTYHYGSPRNINMVRGALHSLPQRIITNDIVVYSTHDLSLVVEDCAFLSRIGKSDVGKTDDVTFIEENSRMAWEDIIGGLTSIKNLTE